MPKIQVLPRHVAELIAAGEVVERPSSVVKELMENSIDAGASAVTLEIRRGGITYIRITDNGCGIAREDAPTAFVSHATSKIRREEDLNGIGTLGFRGEALASIAAVARVELLTRTQGEPVGTRLCVEGGEQTLLDDAGCPQGTTLIVRDLFYNTPARMKFLKKDVSEANAVAGVVDRVALSHPEVSVRFIRDGKEALLTPGDGKLISAIYAVYGKDFATGLLPVDYELSGVRISGFAAKPLAARPNRTMQLFFLNGRLVKSRTAMAALEEAYRNTIMVGKFPACVLHLHVPNETVDVNVHPAKIEVRFARENDIFDLVYHAVKLSLSQPGTGERLFTFDESKNNEKSKNEELNDIIEENTVKKNGFTGLSAILSGQAAPGTLPHHTAQPAKPVVLSIQAMPTASAGQTAAFQKTETELSARETGKEEPEHSWTTVASDTPLQQGVSLHSPEPEEGTSTEEPDAEQLAETEREALEPPTFRAAANEAQLDVEPEGDEQTSGKDHMAAWNPAPPAKPQKSVSSGFAGGLPGTPEQMGFDVQDGPEPLRYVGELFKTYILAERGDEICIIDKHAAHERQLFEKLAADYGDVPSQLLLEPVVVELSAEEKMALLNNLPLLESAGLEMDDFGGNSVFLRSVPADVEQSNAEDLLVELAAKLARGSRDALNEKTEWVLHSISCRAAIKAGDKTSPQELMALAEKILSGEVPPFCPHGRPCVLKLTRKELEKQFGRIV